MKVTFVIALCSALLLVSCSAISPEVKLRRDLIGHTTGGAHSAWLFRAGQIKRVKILLNTGDRIEAALILQSAETKEKFFAIVRVDYFYCLTNCHERVESVGLLYIKKL